MKPNPNEDVACEANAKEKRRPSYLIVRLTIPLMMLAFGIYVQQTTNSLIRNSSSIAAELISPPQPQRMITRYGEREDSSHSEYPVDYRFTVDGKSHTGHDRVKSAPQGAWITIHYEIGNPANNRVNLPSGNEGWVWILLAFLLGLAMNRNLWCRAPTSG